jgi:beta-glucosidase
LLSRSFVLRGFKRLHLEPGASTTVSFDVGPDQLAILDAQMRKKVESGPVDVLVGSSSAETSSIRLTVQDPDLTP